MSDTPYLAMHSQGTELSQIIAIMLDDVAKREKENEECQKAVTSNFQKEFETIKEAEPVEEPEPTGKKTFMKEAEETKEYRLDIEMIFQTLEEKERFKEIMEQNGFGYEVKKFRKVTLN